MAIPTPPCVAMFRGEPQDAQADARRRTLTMPARGRSTSLTAPSTAPPTDFSIIGRKGGDEVLLNLALKLAREGITRRPQPTAELLS